MTEYLIIPQPDPMDELPEGVRGWLFLNARPLRQVGVRSEGGRYLNVEKPVHDDGRVWEPVFAVEGGRPPGPKTERKYRGHLSSDWSHVKIDDDIPETHLVAAGQTVRHDGGRITVVEAEPKHLSWRASVHEPLPKPCLMHGSQHNVGECAWSRGELPTVDEAIQAYDQAKDTE